MFATKIITNLLHHEDKIFKTHRLDVSVGRKFDFLQGKK